MSTEGLAESPLVVIPGSVNRICLTLLRASHPERESDIAELEERLALEEEGYREYEKTLKEIALRLGITEGEADCLRMAHVTDGGRAVAVALRIAEGLQLRLGGRTLCQALVDTRVLTNEQMGWILGELER